MAGWRQLGRQVRGTTRQAGALQNIQHPLPTPSVPKLHPTSLRVRRLPLNQLQRHLPLGLRVVCQAAGIVHRLHWGIGGVGVEWKVRG